MIDWKKEIIDQTLHFLMGLIALPLAYFVSIPFAVIVTRITWMAREYWQHNRIIWWNLDLLFIDIGIITAVIVCLTIK